MRKIILILLVGVGLFMVSCSSDINLKQELFCKDSVLPSNNTWQKQLEYALDKNRTKTRVGTDEIFLSGYFNKGVINSEEEIPSVIEHLFSDESFIVHYIDNERFEILPLKTFMKEMSVKNVDYLFSDVRTQLEDIIKVGMDLIELEWSYKGKTFSTIAIASNDYGGIIYDSIGSFIIDSVKDWSNTEVLNMDIPLIKTRTEQGGDGIVKRSFAKGQTILNGFGVEAVSFGIVCNSYFKNNILVDRKMNTFHDTVIGWSCAADIKTLNGAINNSNYHEFAWGYAYSSLSTASLSFGGFGFSISAGSTGETGTEVHRP